jgi:hypothetical protein
MIFSAYCVYINNGGLMDKYSIAWWFANGVHSRKQGYSSKSHARFITAKISYALGFYIGRAL